MVVVVDVEVVVVGAWVEGGFVATVRQRQLVQPLLSMTSNELEPGLQLHGRAGGQAVSGLEGCTGEDGTYLRKILIQQVLSTKQPATMHGGWPWWWMASVVAYQFGVAQDK